MEYIIFSRKNVSSKSGDAQISFARNGVIGINHHSAQLMGLEKGSGIIILQSKSNQKDWYLSPSKSTEAFILRKISNGTRLGFNCSSLCSVIFSLSGVSEQVTHLNLTISHTPISDNGNELYLIIFNSKK